MQEHGERASPHHYSLAQRDGSRLIKANLYPLYYTIPQEEKKANNKRNSNKLGDGERGEKRIPANTNASHWRHHSSQTRHFERYHVSSFFSFRGLVEEEEEKKKSTMGTIFEYFERGEVGETGGDGERMGKKLERSTNGCYND